MEPKQTKEEDQQNKIPNTTTTNQTPSLRPQHHPSPPAISQTETLPPVLNPSTEPLKMATLPSPSPVSQRRSPPSPPHDSPVHSPSSSDDNQPLPQPTAVPAEYHTSPLSDSPLHSPSSSGKSSPKVPEQLPAVKHPAPAPAPAVAQFPPPRPRRHYKPPSPAAEDSPLHSLSPDSTSAKPSPALSQYVPEKAIVVSEGFSTVEVAGSDDLGRGGGRKRVRPELSILRRARREAMVNRASLALRICGLVLCLVSFSVMAANRHEGWALDSFYRYKEFRYCITVNVVGFVYAGLQAFDSAYFLSTGKRLAQHRLRCYLDFSLDQILSYLLISSSSSAATRVDDWQSNWGKDVFTEMASASVGLSFVAFAAFAFSSLISGYNLCTLNSI